MEAAHGSKIFPIIIAIEHVFDALLNTVCDFFDPFSLG